MLGVLFGAFLVPTWPNDGPPRCKDHKAAGALAAVYRVAREEHSLRLEPFGSADGTVVEVTEDTLTIRCRSGFLRAFVASPALASKRIPLEWRMWCCHRLNQVRVGDFVGIDVVPTPRGDVIIALSIYRRPGGLIPPAEDEHLHERMRTHNVMNRGQAKEGVQEKLVPKLARVFAAMHR